MSMCKPRKFYSHVTTAAFICLSSHAHAQQKVNQPMPCTDVIAFGAVGDGLTDDTAAITRGLNSGKLCIHIPNGVFRISSTITVPPGVLLKGNGYNSHLNYTSNTSAVVRMSDNSEISGLNIDANNYGRSVNAVTAIEVLGSHNVHIHDNIINNSGRDGVYVGEATSPPHEAFRITIANNAIDRSQRNAISVVSGRDILIRGNMLTNWELLGIDLEPNAGGIAVNNITVDSNYVYRNATATSACLQASTGSATADAAKYYGVVFNANYVVGNPDTLNPTMIRIKQFPSSSVTNNYIFNFTKAIMIEPYTTDITISHNILASPSSVDAPDGSTGAIYVSGNAEVTSNSIDGAPYSGIVFNFSKDSVCRANVVKNTGKLAPLSPGKSEAIYAIQSERLTISDNTIINDQGQVTMRRGIYIRGERGAGRENHVGPNNIQGAALAVQVDEPRSR